MTSYVVDLYGDRTEVTGDPARSGEVRVCSATHPSGDPVGIMVYNVKGAKKLRKALRKAIRAAEAKA